MRKAADWLVSIQNPDGGWGEDGTSYKLDYRGYEPAPSTASQTAWALIGLMAAGAIDSPAVQRGIDYLLRTQGVGRLLGGRTLHGDGFSACVLSALPRLRQILPALGAGALPQHHPAALRQIWHVTPSGTPDARHGWPALQALDASGARRPRALRHRSIVSFRQREPIRHQVCRHLVQRHHVIGKPPPRLVLAEQFNARESRAR